MKQLAGKAALVTGASSGIGKAIAAELVRQGCRVALLARGEPGLLSAKAEIMVPGADIITIPCDLSSAAEARRSIREAESVFGQIDILINNVGAGTFKPLHLMSDQECDIATHLPLTSALTAVHALVPGMRERGYGHVVNLTSPAGIFPLPFMVPYSVARHAMVGLNDALYEECRGTGVGVSLVCPAQVNTGYFEANDADMGWYPKISSLFPVSEPERVGRMTLKAIHNNQREMIFPLLLKVSVTLFRIMPRTSIALFRLLGLWGPANKV